MTTPTAALFPSFLPVIEYETRPPASTVGEAADFVTATLAHSTVTFTWLDVLLEVAEDGSFVAEMLDWFVTVWQLVGPVVLIVTTTVSGSPPLVFPSDAD